MTFYDLVRLAASNLWRRKMRTFLTVLGVIIGTACITIMMALGIGNMEQFNELIMQDSDLTQIEVFGESNSNSSGVSEQSVHRFKAIENVSSVTGVLSIPAYIVMGKYSAGTQVLAVDPEAMGFSFAEGEVFSDSNEIELVMGSNVGQYFTDGRGTPLVSYNYYDEGETSDTDIDWLSQKLDYYPSWNDGSDIEVTPDNPAPKLYKATVSGVLAPAEDNESYNIYISMKAAETLIKENRKLMENQNVSEGTYSSAYVNVDDVANVQAVLDSIKEMGFQAYSPTEWISQMQDQQRQQQSQLIAIGLISLLVSAIGIANTMLASILERKREIGVMKVIGLSISKINVMFLVESAMIGLSGGIIGLIISYVLAAITSIGGGEMSLFGMYFEHGVAMSIPWWLSLGAVAIATFVGIISGIYPAKKAMKMSPLEAIRGGE